MLEIHRVARLGAVEVDHMEVLSTRPHPSKRARQRVRVIDGLDIKVTLDQTNCAAFEDVYRRVELHRARGALAARQMRAKLPSIRSPAADDFSGWNWTP